MELILANLTMDVFLATFGVFLSCDAGIDWRFSL